MMVKLGHFEEKMEKDNLDKPDVTIRIIPKQKSEKKRRNGDLKWRNWSKNIAYLDLILICLGLPVGIICVIMRVNVGVAAHPALEKFSVDQKDRIKKAVAISITLLVILAGLGICAAIKLMNATQIGRDPKEALKMARFWKNVNLLFIGLALMGMFFTQAIATCGILMWDAVLLYVVFQYIQELETSQAERDEKIYALQKLHEIIRIQVKMEHNMPNQQNDEEPEKLITEKPEKKEEV